MDFRSLGRAQQRIARLETDIDSTNRSLRYYQRRCFILEAILSDCDPSLMPPRGGPQQEKFYEWYLTRDIDCNANPSPVETTETFSSYLIREIDRNSQLASHGRRWSFSTTMLCFLVFSMARKGYEYIRQFIALPSKQTLMRRVREPIETWRSSLLDIEHLPLICDLFRRRHGIDASVVVDVGIGVDAIAMEKVGCDCLGAQRDHNHVFAFCLLPLSPDYKPLMFHLQTHHNGNAGKKVIGMCQWLCNSLSLLKFNVRFFATDGDAGYNPWNEGLFFNWWPTFCTLGIEEALSVLEKARGPIVSDFLHLMKNARSRILSGPVTISPYGWRPFSSQTMNRILKLEKALTDLSTTGKMKDIYPLEIFTLENFTKLVRAGELASAFYVLPYAMWATLLRNPILSRQTRIDLLAFVVQIFSHHHDCLQNLDRQKVSEKKNPETSCVYFCSTSKCRRSLNTAMILLRELRKFENIALDRVGTHVLECSFGTVRILCQYKHSWSRILKSFSQLLLTTDFMTILGRSIHPRSRINDAGVKMRASDENCVYIEAPNVDMREIYDSVNMILAKHSGSKAFGIEILKEMAPKLVDFLDFISALLHELQQRGEVTPKLWHRSDISNGTIIARLIAFCKTPEIGELDGGEEREVCEDACNEFVESIVDDGDLTRAVSPLQNH